MRLSCIYVHSFNGNSQWNTLGQIEYEKTTVFFYLISILCVRKSSIKNLAQNTNENFDEMGENKKC